MELSRRGRKNTIIFLLTLTLITVGLALTFSTWRTIRQQSESSLQYMSLSARAISRIIASSLHRSMMMGQESALLSQLNGFFNDGDANFDVAFIQVVKPEPENGESSLFFASRSDIGSFPLPDDALSDLSNNEVWYGILENSHQKVFVYASPVAVKTGTIVGKGQGRGQHHMGGGQQITERMILKIGLNLDSAILFSESFKRSAILQVVYILAAAVFVWLLAVGLISKRELAGKARYLQRFQAQLLDNIPDGLFTVGSSGIIEATNKAMNVVVGMASGSLTGKKISSLPPPLSQMVEEALKNNESDVTWKHLGLEGQQFEVLITSFYGNSEEKIHLVLLRNRTKVVNLEKSLADAEKRAAIGVLAAGVAHEIRNPLTALRGFAQYFAKKFAGVAPDEEYARTMVSEADRLNRVITDLLYLSRPKLIESAKVSLSSICSAITALMRFDLQNKSTALEVNLEVDIIWADEDSLKQSLLNMVLNSLDAISERADLYNHDGGRPLDQESDFKGIICISSKKETDGVVIEVSDNGIGMSLDEAKRACDAFYTSKSKGTGLGLALVTKAVQELSGRLEIKAIRNVGCSVSIHLPEVKDDI